MIHNISVIIPSLGHLQSLQGSLNSIRMQTVGNENFEVLVVINGLAAQGSKIAIEALVTGFGPNFKVFFLETKGANLARNYGLVHAKSNLLFFLDDDCQLSYPGFLKSHIDYHKLNPGVFAAGGGYTLAPSYAFYDEIYNYLQMRWFLSAATSAPKCRFLLGGNFSIKKSLLGPILFDESIVYGGTEYDFFKRAEIAGLEMHMNQSDVIHKTNETLSGLTRKIRKQGAGKAVIDGRYPQGDLAVVNYDGWVLLSLRWRVALLYFNYVFWAGYYGMQGRSKRLVVHIAKDILGYFNFFRYKTIERVNKKIADKENQGNRF